MCPPSPKRLHSPCSHPGHEGLRRPWFWWAWILFGAVLTALSDAFRRAYGAVGAFGLDLVDQDDECAVSGWAERPGRAPLIVPAHMTGRSKAARSAVACAGHMSGRWPVCSLGPATIHWTWLRTQGADSVRCKMVFFPCFHQGTGSALVSFLAGD